MIITFQIGEERYGIRKSTYDYSCVKWHLASDTRQEDKWETMGSYHLKLSHALTWYLDSCIPTLMEEGEIDCAQATKLITDMADALRGALDDLEQKGAEIPGCP